MEERDETLGRLPRDFWSNPAKSRAYSDGWRARMAGHGWPGAQQFAPAQHGQLFQLGWVEGNAWVRERDARVSGRAGDDRAAANRAAAPNGGTNTPRAGIGAMA